jgi:hypothetical protein
MLKVGKGYSNKVFSAYRRRFYRRFKHLAKYIEKEAIILCAGARQGTEVEVLWDMGYKNAYGIDLNPGPDNKWVKDGDFLKIDAEDGSIDLIYTNAVDHAFDLEKMFAEHARVIKPKVL